MPDFQLTPPTPTKEHSGSFLQMIRMTEAGKLIGTVSWHVDEDEGVVQLLGINVLPAYRRRGYGGRLLVAVLEQSSTFLRARKTPLRRIWATVEQKSHVLARAFLTRHGFHHVSTISELYKDQDALIYTKAYD